MEMDLEKQVSDMQLKNELQDKGFIIIKNFFPKEYIINLRKKAENIFQIQFDRFNYNGSFKENMIQLFNENQEVFINCGKIIQSGLIELYQLPLEKNIIDLIKNLGISF